MQVQEVMTSSPTCCTPEMNLRDVACMMVNCDCGAIPVVDGQDSMHLLGVITDRDITCRTVAQGKNPLDMTARDCLTSPVATVAPEASLEECCRIMEENQVRRILVADGNGCCCGIVAQADIALHAPDKKTAEVVKDISTPGSKTTTTQMSMRH